jgi:glucose/arabinose dehydrogenase
VLSPPPLDGGKNYGWPFFEGTLLAWNETVDPSMMEFPQMEYINQDYKNASFVIGGYVYR